MSEALSLLHSSTDFAVIVDAIWIVLSRFIDHGVLTMEGFFKLHIITQYICRGVIDIDSAKQDALDSWNKIGIPITKNVLFNLLCSWILVYRRDFNPLDYAWFVGFALIDTSAKPPKLNVKRTIKPIFTNEVVSFMKCFVFQIGMKTNEYFLNF